jgi:hypothetical protein
MQLQLSFLYFKLQFYSNFRDENFVKIIEIYKSNIKIVYFCAKIALISSNLCQTDKKLEIVSGFDIVVLDLIS